MKTYFKDYGVTASITTNRDGSARLVARDPMGKKVRDRVYTTYAAATAAWRRLCR